MDARASSTRGGGARRRVRERLGREKQGLSTPGTIHRSSSTVLHLHVAPQAKHGARRTDKRTRWACRQHSTAGRNTCLPGEHPPSVRPRAHSSPVSATRPSLSPADVATPSSTPARIAALGCQYVVPKGCTGATGGVAPPATFVSTCECRYVLRLINV